MSEHLPDCPCQCTCGGVMFWETDGTGKPTHTPSCAWFSPCICDRLRACEQRVTHKEFLLDEGDPYREVYRSGYRKGLAAAREVVSWTQDVDDALDAINALADMDDPQEPRGLPEPPPLPPSLGVPTNPMWPLRKEH